MGMSCEDWDDDGNGYQPFTLQASDFNTFEEKRWRNCILFFLFGIWSDDAMVMCCPKINFGNIVLRLDPITHEYSGYCLKGDCVEGCGASYHPEFMLEVGPTQQEVENGLIRFVKNPRIKQLVIRLRKGEIWLSKGEKRSHLEVACFDIPDSMS